MCRSADLHRARLPGGESNSPTVEAYPTQAATQVQSQSVGESMAPTAKSAAETMRDKLRTTAGSAVYKMRNAVRQVVKILLCQPTQLAEGIRFIPTDC
jgi:hypothetical protein